MDDAVQPRGQGGSVVLDDGVGRLEVASREKVRRAAQVGMAHPAIIPQTRRRGSARLRGTDEGLFHPASHSGYRLRPTRGGTMRTVQLLCVAAALALASSAARAGQGSGCLAHHPLYLVLLDPPQVIRG